MAKKRKAAGRQLGSENVELPTESSRKRIRTFEDVADSEDEFHLNQDRVLLDESAEARRKRRDQEREALLEPSDEEVLNGETDLEESDYVSADDQAGPQDDAEEDAEDAWGTTRAELYGADAIETEEQALEEETEARRLQRKHLQSMSAADYGFDEDEWRGEAVALDKQLARPVLREKLPELQIADTVSSAERLKLLKARYPEFDLLRRELLLLDEKRRQLRQERDSQSGAQPNLQSKLQALTAYLGSLAMYFALLTSGSTTSGTVAILPSTQLRDHDVMNTLVQCRTLWQATADLPPDEHIVLEAVDEQLDDEPAIDKVQSKRLSKRDRRAAAEQRAKEAQISDRLSRIDADFANLDSKLSSLNSRPSERPRLAHDADLGEEARLTAAQAEEKARKRKSLRFYTSQIAQKANKRSEAGRVAGGDDDVPHRERLRDRQIRLNAEAEKRGKRSNVGDDLGAASDDDDAKQARQIRDEVDQDDYYDMVASRTSKKKADKVDKAEVQRLAAEQGGRVVEQETVGADGKRKITYAIEKNKGLTPNRRKDIRNPRVKKRKKFEQKTKKLASMKPTFKGGEGRGGYGGELTGIKSNLVKSVKL